MRHYSSRQSNFTQCTINLFLFPCFATFFQHLDPNDCFTNANLVVKLSHFFYRSFCTRLIFSFLSKH